MKKKKASILQVSGNRFLDALFKLMLFSAIVHMVIVIVVSVVRRDVSYLNFFRIIGVDLFIPYIDKGLPSQFMSLSLAVLLYGVIYFFYTKKD